MAAAPLLPDLRRFVVLARPNTQARLVAGKKAGSWRLIVRNYPKDLYRQLLRQVPDSGVVVRLLDRRKAEAIVGLQLDEPGERKVALGVLKHPARLVLDVGPPELVSSGVPDLEPPFVLLPVELGQVELPMPDPDYPRSPLEVPGAKEYNHGRALLRRGDAQGAIDAVTTYLAQHPDGQLVPFARFIHGEAMFQIVRESEGAGARQAAKVLREAREKDRRSPYAARALLLAGRSLAAAGMHAEALPIYDEGIGRFRGPLAHAFHLGAAVSAAEAGSMEKARDHLEPLWEGTVPPEVGALARLIEAFMLYRKGECRRVAPMLHTSLRLDRVLAQRHPVAVLMLAECLVDVGRPKAAGQLYDDLARREPPLRFLPYVRVRQGDLLFRAADPVAARNDWLAVMVRFPAGDARGLARMRLALDAQTNPEVALSFLDEAIDSGGPTSQEARYRKALFLLRNGNWDAATVAAGVLADGRDSPYKRRADQIRLRAVYLAFARDDAAGRIQPLVDRYLRTKRWLSSHPSALRIHRATAAAFKRLGLPRHVVETLQAALGRYEGTQAERGLLLDLAEAYIEQRDGYRATRIVRYLDAYVMKGAKSLRLAVARAEAAAWSGKPLLAARGFDRALRLARAVDERVRILARKAAVLMGANKLDAAAAVFARCRKQDPTTALIGEPHTPAADCQFGLGEALYRLDRWRKAGEALSAAADRYPKDRRRARARARAVIALRRAPALAAAIEQAEKSRRARNEEAKAGGPAAADHEAESKAETAAFWNRVGTEVAEDAGWDRDRAGTYRTLMKDHE